MQAISLSGFLDSLNGHWWSQQLLLVRKYPNKELLPPDPHYVITIIKFVHVITYSDTEKYFSPYQSLQSTFFKFLVRMW